VRGALGRALGAAGRRQAPMRARRSDSVRPFFVRAAAAHPCPLDGHPPGHIAATLPARQIRVNDPHLAGPGPIDAESAGASIPTFASASRSRGGNRGEDESCCPPCPSFLYYITEKEGTSYKLKGSFGRAGWAAWAPSRKPSHFRRRLTLIVSYRETTLI
jgi:hypothetical protein